MQHSTNIYLEINYAIFLVHKNEKVINLLSINLYGKNNLSKSNSTIHHDQNYLISYKLTKIILSNLNDFFLRILSYLKLLAIVFFFVLYFHIILIDLKVFFLNYKSCKSLNVFLLLSIIA